MTWTDEYKADRERWARLGEIVGRTIPCKGLEYIGGGEVLHVAGEGDHCWIGSCEADDGDGPWIGGSPAYVGGYRYRPLFDACGEFMGEVMTDRVMVEVADPDDDDMVAEAIIAAARMLATMPFGEEVY
jgi:hypothetical protein